MTSVSNILKEAKELNERLYKKEINFYGVGYISDYCISDCLYCGDRKSNLKKRKRLSLEEFEKDVDKLIKIGHKTICFLTGEDPKLTTESLIEYLKLAQSKNLDEIILNIPPKSTENFTK